MKIVYQGDLHLRDSTPVNRVDNYWEAQWDKLSQLVQFTQDYNAVLMLGGDIFDTPKVSAETVNKAVDILEGTANWCHAVLGQHDVPYHDIDIKKSPVYSLYQANRINTIQSRDFIDFSLHNDDYRTTVHYCAWSQVPSTPVDGHINILLAHLSVFDKIPFYWKGEGYTPDTLRKKYPGFDLYLCGDIHDPLVDDNVAVYGSSVVVSGSMMRMSINQINHRPRAYLIDTDDMSIEPLYYKINQDVFNIPDKVVKESLELDGLVNALKESSIGKQSYERDCISLADKDEPVKKIITEVLDDIN